MATVLGARGAEAQVGHDPEHSPYRDITRSGYLIFTGGQFFGGGGKVGVAPHNGWTAGLRYALMGNRSLQVNFGATYGALERLVQDPSQPAEERASGPVRQSVLWFEAGLQLNLTGNKTWHGLAPFVGAAAGLSFSGDPPEEVTDYRFGTKFFLAPLAGTRVFIGQGLYLMIEGRALFWQVKYPDAYRANNPSLPEDPPLITGSAAEWLVSPWVVGGLGWSIRLPF